jgi:hypothetical protein
VPLYNRSGIICLTLDTIKLKIKLWHSSHTHFQTRVNGAKRVIYLFLTNYLIINPFQKNTWHYNVIKSPKQSLGDLLFLLRFFFLLLLLFSSLYSPFFLWHMNLSTADLRNYWTEFHETWWCYRYMFLVGPKFFSFVVKAVKVIF